MDRSAPPSQFSDEGLKPRPQADRPGDAIGARPAKPGVETFISSDTQFEGRIVAKSEIRIDGLFKGEIASSNRVVVGAAGKVEGTVEANAMVISGRVVGNLRILERLELLATGELYGDLETQPGALIIEQGARMEGRCSMGLNQEGRAAAAAPRKPQPAPAGPPPAAPQAPPATPHS